jgi:hypothetical protein
MPYIIDQLSRRPGGMFQVYDPDKPGNSGNGWDEIPTYTCCHCMGVVWEPPGYDKSDRFTCKRCMRFACPQPGCRAACRNVLEVDGPLAYNDADNQPWMLRDEQGYPVDRLWTPDGTGGFVEKLVRRKDNGMTSRQLSGQVIPPGWMERSPAFERIEHLRKEKAMRDQITGGPQWQTPSS